MKKRKFIVFALCVTAISWGGCNHNSDETLVEETPIEETPTDETVGCECEDGILKVLKDEPAYVVKGYFGFENETETLCFAILNQSVWAYYYIFPYSEIPQNYQIDRLEVLISGNITNCTKPRSNPTVRYMPAYLFELTSIKLLKN